MIPSELVTRKEAMEILGIKSDAVFNRKRFNSLRYTAVIYKGSQIILYNRNAVEALKYKPCPDGYINTKEAMKILGLSGQCYVCNLLRNHGLIPVRVKAHHSYYAWNREAVENVKKIRNSK